MTEFKVADDALNANLIKLAREGIPSTEHKPAVVRRDVELLCEKKLLGLETPESLLQTAWFNIILHFEKRGRENMRDDGWRYSNPQIKHRLRLHPTS